MNRIYKTIDDLCWEFDFTQEKELKTNLNRLVVKDYQYLLNHMCKTYILQSFTELESEVK